MMIKKLIDNYFTNALIRELKSQALINGLDLKVTEVKNRVLISVKDRKYRSDYYKIIFKFNKEDSIYYVCNLLETNKEFKELIKKYQKIEVL